MRPLRSQEPSGPPVEDTVDAPRASIADVLPQPRTVRFGSAPTVTVVLPNGRTAWLRLGPAPAPLSQVKRLARSSAVEEARQVLVSRDDALAIRHLGRTSAADARRLVRERLRDERGTLGSLAERDTKINAAISAAQAKAEAELQKSIKELRRVVQKLRRRGLWDDLVLISAAPLFAAYGERGDPFGTANLTLLISLAVWLVGEDVSDWLTGEKSIRGGILRDVDLWSYISPFANLLTGWWLLSDSQHERFVSGVVSSFSVSSNGDPPVDVYTATVDVAGTLIASDYAPEFASFSNVPVVATITSVTQNPAFKGAAISIGSATASVSGGLLTIVVVASANGEVPLPIPLPIPQPIPQPIPKPIPLPILSFPPPDHLLTQLSVAWIVDTKEPAQ